ncbi:hypothetical protein RR46_10644 [Papilio xuthus]|uniref:Uncharacterized protein n=1 Tax=Papilio xuthus TaxID=66420 RepID=A0A194PKX6_PAPXU|nr:hypothetical protein RR46_10644 [Papilio xuthus]
MTREARTVTSTTTTEDRRRYYKRIFSIAAGPAAEDLRFGACGPPHAIAFIAPLAIMIERMTGIKSGRAESRG